MADLSDPPSHNATPKLIHRDLEYGSIDAEAPLDRADSGVEVSPIEPPSGYTYRQQYRIIPPRISGHGRLIAARRTVPYWIGLVSVVGAFAWAVLCAIYIYRLGGG
ncbi:hypothetical protein T440DRAFT_411400 [Plenodomus tracheiphilus IPT5]|uniref:Uncharacterized protein n=1 Tax=Plenodomus tracheiphilus IPT5 TaxID=1408161 RepID=A0A6A7BNR5_9PLEO|nr:hypothetical protein T440DRAFT_411400 [Plenodomus tracheiphilus IPT5]